MNSQQAPWVILNAAMTTDGKIDTVSRKGAGISSDQDWSRVDHLRAEVDAVMVGGHTLIAEDPRLTVKSPKLRQQRIDAGQPENPAKVGIISNAQIPTGGKFVTEGNASVYVFTTGKTNREQITTLQSAGVNVHLSKSHRVNLAEAMRHLKSAGINKVLLEGGGTLNAAMFAQGLINELRLYIAPRIFGGSTAPTLADGPGLPLDQAVHLSLQNIETLPDGGILTTYLIIKNTEKR